jgi:acetyl-CoA C-acetyltransferase
MKMVDAIEFDALYDAFVKKNMGNYLEEIANQYGITRKEMDDYTIGTYDRYLKAKEKGYINKEITNLGKLTEDEQPKKYNKEKIPNLPAAFKKGGRITAASSSPLSDGAAALLLCSQEFALTSKLKIRAKVIAYADAEVTPKEFPIAISYAICNALRKAHMKVEDIGAFEINEAFAAVPILVERILNIPKEKINIHGGAIAIGHPLGASGARIIGTLLCVMEAYNIRYGCAGICNGGGGGTAVIIELQSNL